jgi:hypothetical protein
VPPSLPPDDELLLAPEELDAVPPPEDDPEDPEDPPDEPPDEPPDDPPDEPPDPPELPDEEPAPPLLEEQAPTEDERRMVRMRNVRLFMVALPVQLSGHSGSVRATGVHPSIKSSSTPLDVDHPTHRPSHASAVLARKARTKSRPIARSPRPKPRNAPGLCGFFLATVVP